MRFSTTFISVALCFCLLTFDGQFRSSLTSSDIVAVEAKKRCRPKHSSSTTSSSVAPDTSSSAGTSSGGHTSSTGSSTGSHASSAGSGSTSHYSNSHSGSGSGHSSYSGSYSGSKLAAGQNIGKTASGAQGAVTPTQNTAGPNGSEDWMNTGMDGGGGWQPPQLLIENLSYISIEDFYNTVGQNCRQYADTIAIGAAYAKVPETLVAAIAMQESSCNANAQSYTPGIPFSLVSESEIVSEHCKNRSDASGAAKLQFGH